MSTQKQKNASLVSETGEHLLKKDFATAKPNPCGIPIH